MAHFNVIYAALITSCCITLSHALKCIKSESVLTCDQITVLSGLADFSASHLNTDFMYNTQPPYMCYRDAYDKIEDLSDGCFPANADICSEYFHKHITSITGPHCCYTCSTDLCNNGSRADAKCFTHYTEGNQANKAPSISISTFVAFISISILFSFLSFSKLTLIL